MQEAGAKNRRRDRLKFVPGAGSGAAAHDDLAIALALACEAVDRDVGRARLPVTFNVCWREQSVPGVNALGCYLFGGSHLPDGDPCCKECIGHRAVQAAWRASGPVQDMRSFYKERMLPNDFVSVRQAQEWADRISDASSTKPP